MKRILHYLFDITVLKIIYYVFDKMKQRMFDFMYSEEGSHSAIVLNQMVQRVQSHAFSYKHNLQAVLFERAVEESADFVEKHLKDVLVFRDIFFIWNYAILRVKEREIDGVCIELGVFGGSSINYFADRLPETDFFGFDSFEGLAEDWKGNVSSKGAFDLGGELPAVSSNVTLVKGWFDKTLPEFCRDNLKDSSIKFIHIDCDTYESTFLALEELSQHLTPGLLLLFDEFIGWPNWRNGEFRAWHEIVKKYNIKFRYLAFAPQQALVEIIN